MTIRERIAATGAILAAADRELQAALDLAFGKNACERRYDWDTSGHPPECNALRKRHQAASADYCAAWQAAFEAARNEDATGDMQPSEPISPPPRTENVCDQRAAARCEEETARPGGVRKVGSSDSGPHSRTDQSADAAW